MEQETLFNFMMNVLGVDTSGLQADTPLFSSGILDSAGMVELMVFVETEAQVRFGQDDITLENLDSVERILRFIERQRAARTE